MTFHPLASDMGWGSWRLCEDGSHPLERIDAAIESGFTLFDTADIYGADTKGFGAAEELLGRMLRDRPGLRDQICLATKGGIRPGFPYDSSRNYLLDAVEASLRRLRVERIDLYQIHRRDWLTPPDELASTLDMMVDSGKVGAVGVSNYAPSELAALRSFARTPILTTQPEFSLWHPQPLHDGTLDDAMTHGTTVLAWSPLGGGRLTRCTDRLGETLHALAEQQNVDSAAIALSWVMAHSAGVIPIVGSQSPERIRRAADARKVLWTRNDWYRLLEAAIGQKLP
ncbi:aldo/keto reductase [Sphingomonas histidinilytica]|uniref:Predicted oxidoreductase n=2 Tax=Rhizorhabdus histidinilytica TaxID=439228 RepID=A0A1T5G9V5_9SPHN|nr:aldo/keto reductase [Rhizorhabdus histidinilytica]MBO9379880.1 aldo/keto reductase [Rhizorhabdus histidinilytica]QEH77149.1 aldo/keto reductase [Sphingomonas sp. C8-2]SKC05081.1 Predicted oxidoreductase [Rhizorhabdus histidinilytica]